LKLNEEYLEEVPEDKRELARIKAGIEGTEEESNELEASL